MTLSIGWSRQPFVGLCLATLLGISIAEAAPHPLLGVAVALATALFALLKRSAWATYGFVVAGFFALHSMRQTEAPGVRLARELGPHPLAVTALGVITSEPKIGARGMASFHLALRWIERDGKRESSSATIFARWRGEVRFGDEVQLFGIAEPVEGPRNPGEFNMRAYLARRDICHALVVRHPENGRILSRGGGSRIMRAAQASRNWMQAALALGLEDSPDLNSLISGMVLGVRDETPDEIEEQFQQTGTLHLFAVSGLNVAIVAQLLWTIASALRMPRKLAVGVIIPALFFYAAVTGLNTSSLRAAVMAAVLLAGFLFDRKVLAVNSVAAAGVLILGYNTNQLFSTGFQLSFAVVIAIVFLADPLFRFFVRWSEADPFLPESLLSPVRRMGQRSWQVVALGASVSLAAWIGSLPLILPYFYLITPISLFANLVVVPLAFFVLAVGLMSLLVISFLPWLAIIFNNANWTLAATILGAVGLFARAPAGHFYLELPRWPTGARTDITALDLGDGAAVHVRDRRVDWLVDTGGESDFKRVVRGYLRSRGINYLDGLILTHGDSRHLGGASALVRIFRPREIIDTAGPDRSRAHRDLIAWLQEQNLRRRLSGSPDKVEVSRRVTARVLFPPPSHAASNADDQAMVVQLVIAERWRVLLMSDSGEATERMLLQSGADLSSHIMIKGQHHSGNSGSAEFLKRVRPEAIIAAAPEFPENERIKEEWAEAVNASGIKLFRQDRTGAVALRFFRDRWEAFPYLRP